jgi:TolB protein
VAPAADAPKGRIAYSVALGDQAEQHSIWIANADGSNAHKIVDLALWPSLSPDGKQIAFYRIKDEGIYVANADGGDVHRILPNETCCVQWSRDSKHLLLVQGKLKAGDTHVKIINPDGTNPVELQLGVSPFNPAWSPDGSKVAYAACDQAERNKCGLFVYDMESKASKMITTDGGGAPQWSPRGDKIVYRAGNPNVFVVNPDGSGLKQLTFGKSNDGQPVWSNDGNFVFWRSDQDGKGWAIYVMRADGSDKHLVINSTPPDGDRWGYESLSAGP